ncbi:2,3,4,5-tetrahydropyridine-2,6-dicarboxylate N-acetyltransferase [Leuconostocaceae bacterium ESL0723]|nr:2,3,4,5-tetrahydropyridine-2,6-dicarboxylate N-acetyltransferase [Lactobacillaceae bacterium L1_55_11]WEV54214.1 2,3,4,5-tetrahydropyridine-2,6-dicarboxylate N-acetyltransferase [Leuconostocaceae bacterium ESL0723]
MAKLDAQSIIKFLAEADKKTPVKVYLKGKIDQIDFPPAIKTFPAGDSAVIFGDWSEVKPFLNDNDALIEDFVLENNQRNSAVPLLDLKELNARIEPGAIIRDQVEIGDHAIVMMGAVINIGAEIGEGSMIDMGAVLGGRAQVGKNSHIGAGAVLAGVVEPASAQPVIVDDEVLVGANAVIIEGVHVGKGAVVAAGAIVTSDVEPYTMVAGTPARKIKDVDAQTQSKTSLEEDLRRL